MRQLTIIFSVLITFTCCKNDKNRDQRMVVKITNSIGNQLDKTKDKIEAINFDHVEKLFFQFAKGIFNLEKTPVSERMVDSYALSQPFRLSKFHEITRFSTKEGVYFFDLIFYTYTNNTYNEALELIEQAPSNGEFIFGKDWDRIFGIDNYLNWKGYECNCGLPCKKI